MLRRYSLAVVGVLLMAALLSAIVRVAPWTQSIPDHLMEQGYVWHAVSEKLIIGFGVLVALALVGFMALGERIGLIQPPKSDVISLFESERPNPVNPEKASLVTPRAGSPARPGRRLVR
jgi:hypothetical protein